jgi:hypothetical protein
MASLGILLIALKVLENISTSNNNVLQDTIQCFQKLIISCFAIENVEA